MDARAVIEEHSRSFALAARLLPAAVRDDGRLLYAWCRHADDAVDLGDRPLAQLRRLERELQAVYAGQPGESALDHAFGELVERRRIPWRYPSELLAGLRMDLEQRRYPTLDDLMPLQRYDGRTPQSDFRSWQVYVIGASFVGWLIRNQGLQTFHDVFGAESLGPRGADWERRWRADIRAANHPPFDPMRHLPDRTRYRRYAARLGF